MASELPPISLYTKDLVREGILTEDQLAVAKVSQENLGEDLGIILIKKGFVTETDLLRFLGQHIQIPFISLKAKKPDPELLHDISYAMAKRYLALPLQVQKEGKVLVAMANPLQTVALEDLKEALHKEIVPVLASPDELRQAIAEAYRKPVSEKPLAIGVLEPADDEHLLDLESKKIEEMASGPKIVAAVNEIISKGWAEGASDIHIEPGRKTCRIRFRLDGILQERDMMNKGTHLAVLSRLKILGGLDIAEHRVPQDGRLRIRLMGRTLDMRIATCPTQFGEKVVIRLLPKENLRNIEDLGFAKKDRQIFSEMIHKNHGLVLVTGPTGSGKTTTLYAALARILSPEINVISIEDPIESEMEGITQIEINPKANLTFASILRSVLRQDPDIIMIGEIRDPETAKIAVRAAITGHLVLATLHTNTASGAITRMIDLGVEPFLLQSALKGVISQRLVRKTCHTCQKKGCAQCGLSGYKGRIGIFEVAPLLPSIAALVHERAQEKEIEKELRRHGILSLREDGLHKVDEGVTTLEEVLHATEED